MNYEEIQLKRPGDGDGDEDVNQGGGVKQPLDLAPRSCPSSQGSHSRLSTFQIVHW